VRIRILGCGTSTGVPKIGNDWGKCDPDEPRNRRMRSSILVESAGKVMLVDCGPDLRQQLLDAEVGRIDGLIVTHDHADHCHGIDDLRPLSQRLRAPVPLHARPDDVKRFQRRFEYAFVQAGFYPPVAELVALGSDLAWGDARFRFVDQPHGGITSLGMRMSGRLPTGWSDHAARDGRSRVPPCGMSATISVLRPALCRCFAAW